MTTLQDYGSCVIVMYSYTANINCAKNQHNIFKTNIYRQV